MANFQRPKEASEDYHDFYSAIRNDQIDVMKSIWKKYSSRPLVQQALLRSARSDDPFAKSRAFVNALEYGHIEPLLFIVQEGPLLDLPVLSIASFASRRIDNRDDIYRLIKITMELGYALSGENDENTPLHTIHFAFMDHKLLEFTVNILEYDMHYVEPGSQLTALHIAAQDDLQYGEHIFCYLIENLNMDIYATDNFGKTPLACAAQYRCIANIEMLLPYYIANPCTNKFWWMHIVDCLSYKGLEELCQVFTQKYIPEIDIKEAIEYGATAAKIHELEESDRGI